MRAEWIPRWPPDWPEIAASVNRCFATGTWGMYKGPLGEELSRRLTKLTGTTNCRLIASGSVGVEVALRSCGVSKGGKVVVCAYDYPGNFRAIESVGARPLLVDAADQGYSASAAAIHAVEDRNVQAVIVSHLYGVAADIVPIRALCDDRGWKLVEDACQVPGMLIAGRPAASWGDVGVLSFGGSKPLTAGCGGAIVTDDHAIEARWGRLLDRPSDSVPMSELQAAAVLPQIDRLESCNRQRARAVAAIRDHVAWLRDGLRQIVSMDQTTFYKLAVEIDDRADTLQRLAERGLPVGAGYRSMHRSSDRRCDKSGTFTRAQTLGNSLCLLDHSALLVGETGLERLLAELNSIAGKLSGP